MSDEKVTDCAVEITEVVTAPLATVVGDVLNPGECVDACEPPLLNQLTSNPGVAVTEEKEKICAVCSQVGAGGVPLLLKDNRINNKVNKIFSEIEADVNKKPLEMNTLMPIVLRAMERIETVKEIQGKSKKEWVLVSMQHMVKQHPLMTEDKRVEILQALVTIIPPLIDNFVDVAKGVYSLASEIQQSGCFGCCSFKSKKLTKLQQ
jgi:hypothetical protein